MSNHHLVLSDHIFETLTGGALYWQLHRTLIVSDLHLEKGSFFQDYGIFLPPYDTLDTLDRLVAACKSRSPERVIFLGDSFHDASGYERMPGDCQRKLHMLSDQAELIWIEGNHDGDIALPFGARSCAELILCGVKFTHIASPKWEGAQSDPRFDLELSGHFHPKIRVRVSRRSFWRKCFLRSHNDRLVLPAFGAFTGGLDCNDAAFDYIRPSAAIIPTKHGPIEIEVGSRHSKLVKQRTSVI